MSKSRLLPCNLAQGERLYFVKYAEQKIAILQFCAKIIRQQ